jgi:hypothetical protein
VPLAERQHPIQAFLFDRSHEAFCIGVTVRRSRPASAPTTRTPTVLSTASIAEVQFGSRSHSWKSKGRPLQLASAG